MRFRNLTPHAIVVVREDGCETVFQPDPSGPARVSVRTETLPAIAGFRLQQQAFGQVENLPEFDGDTVLIVSAMVLAQCKDRADVVAPDTGRDAIRNDAGQVVAVRGFVR